MDNKFNEKSYNKAKTIRKLFRNDMFQKSRQINSNNNSYLSYYSQQLQNSIRQSQQGPIPSELPPAQYATITTISYYRRSNKPVFKTKMNNQQSHDPHMTFQSLWYLAGIQDIDLYPNSEKVIKQFQQNLSTFLTMPYNQIKQMAIIAAGNKILGKQQDILKIVNQDENQLWVLVNHIYERKINYTIMYNYLNKKFPIVYRTIYQMSNNQKDEIIESIMKNQEMLQTLMNCLTQNNINQDILLYTVRIFGNILAQRQDYNEIFMKYELLNKLSILLKNPKPELKKDIMWLLSNYISDPASANQLIQKPYLMQKILMIFKMQNPASLKLELYNILYNLAFYGKKLQFYRIAIEEKILQQCCYDIQTQSSQNNQLILIIFRLILKLIQIAKQYMTQIEGETGGRNPFILFIKSSNLRKYIQGYSYSGNQQISNISFDLQNQIAEEEKNFEEEDM